MDTCPRAAGDEQLLPIISYLDELGRVESRSPCSRPPPPLLGDEFPGFNGHADISWAKKAGRRLVSSPGHRASLPLPAPS